MNEVDWYRDVGATLRQNRGDRGWTIYDVGALVNRAGATVSRWERGEERMKALDYERLRKEGLLP